VGEDKGDVETFVQADRDPVRLGGCLAGRQASESGAVRGALHPTLAACLWRVLAILMQSDIACKNKQQLYHRISRPE
jgi:hypothetical protein